MERIYNTELDTESVPDGWDTKQIPKLTQNNIIVIIDKINEVIAKINEIEDRINYTGRE